MASWNEWLKERFALAKARPGTGVTLRPGAYVLHWEGSDYLLIEVRRSDGLTEWVAIEFLTGGITPGFAFKKGCIMWVTDDGNERRKVEL